MKNKTFINFFLFSFLIFIFTSCEKVIQVDVPEAETLLVVDAWLNDKPGNQVIRLTTTAPVFSSSSTPSASGASIILKDLNNGNTYTFFENPGTGNYIYSPAVGDTFNIIGHKYELEIIYKGNTYKSTSVSYKTTTVDTVGFNEIKNFGDSTIRGFA
ncbi:MAG: DUF4249 family protein, partial [Bacteroidota bacterium]